MASACNPFNYLHAVGLLVVVEKVLHTGNDAALLDPMEHRRDKLSPKVRILTGEILEVATVARNTFHVATCIAYTSHVSIAMRS